MGLVYLPVNPSPVCDFLSDGCGASKRRRRLVATADQSPALPGRRDTEPSPLHFVACFLLHCFPLLPQQQ